MEFIIIAFTLGVYYVLYKVWRAIWIDKDIIIQDFKDRYKSADEIKNERAKKDTQK